MIHVVLIRNKTYIAGTSMISTIDGYNKILSFPDRKLIYCRLWKVEIRKEYDVKLAIEKSQKNNMIAEELGEYFIWLADGWGRKNPYHNSTNYEDMKAYSVFWMCKFTKSIDINKANSCFRYYIQVAIYAYKKFTTDEQKQAKIKNSMKFLQDVSTGGYRYA